MTLGAALPLAHKEQRTCPFSGRSWRYLKLTPNARYRLTTARREICSAPPRVSFSLSEQAPRKSILLVDNDEGMRAAIYFALSPSYRVTLAIDGLDGYTKANQPPPPDLIISDIALPRLDGVEMALRLRENSALRAVPIIFMTGETSTKKLVLDPPSDLAFACLPKSTHLFVLRRKVEIALAGGS
jgi:CheY-like chemotaxis protein